MLRRRLPKHGKSLSVVVIIMIPHPISTLLHPSTVYGTGSACNLLQTNTLATDIKHIKMDGINIRPMFKTQVSSTQCVSSMYTV